jgi:hypothetical protein
MWSKGKEKEASKISHHSNHKSAAAEQVSKLDLA